MLTSSASASTRREPGAPARPRAGVLRLLGCCFALSLLASVSACGPGGRFVIPDAFEADARPPDSTQWFALYLIGDAGAPPVGGAPVLTALEKTLNTAGPNSAAVFLGDNIYPSGMPPVYDPFREEAERRIMAQLRTVDGFAGRVVFVPGNHDWGGNGIGGEPTTLRRQELFIENALDRGNVFLPDNGFPGPVEVPLGDSLTLVVVDTQWWLEPAKIYGDTGQYELEVEGSFLIELDDILRRNADKQVVVVAHHPLFTNGPHGGFFTTQRRFNPLYMVPRRYLGTPQDLSNRKYRILREGILAVFAQHDNLVYAAGHEHALQYFQYDHNHFIVSGSGTKSSYVAEGNGAAFTSPEMGYALLQYYTDGSTWLTFWAPGDDGRPARLLYTTRLVEGNRPLTAYRDEGARPRWMEPDADEGEDEEEDETPAVRPPAAQAAPRPDTLAAPARPGGTPSRAYTVMPGRNGTPPDGGADPPYVFYSKGTVTVPVGAQYDVGPLRRLILGAHYRDVWATPVEIPIIDLDRTAGGLTPIKRGGGLQTKTLRLVGGDGDQYVLRSVNKDPSSSVPEYLRGTVASDIIQDQISALLPFGAYIVPTLAERAGVLHTTPTLVYVPDSERLGVYREAFGGLVALFEQRPDEDQSDEDRFGYAGNVVGSAKLFEEIEEDNDDRVNPRAFARARLLDMLIGDWDRHKDQWRWAEFEDEYGKLYEPIPRDRDFSFFKFDGFLARLARLSGIPNFRRFSNFGPSYGDVLGLNLNGAALDRRFTSALTGRDWVQIADSIRASLTDEVIEQAVRELPAPVFAHQGEDMIEALKVRRDKLTRVAARYYDILSEVVDVVGSDKHERFEVTRLSADSMRVVVYKTYKDGEVVRELYRRTFARSETDEVRLYGLGGDDQFIVTGEADKSIRVRAIGGEGEDRFVDRSRVPGAKRLTRFYDTASGENTWETSGETKVYRVDDPAINSYDMLRFQFDILTPIASFGYNRDDGLFVGAGLRIVKQGFRKDPYATSHRMGANFAVRTRAYNVLYDGDYINLVGPWDGRLSARLQAIDRYRNFYGLGNETPDDANVLYNAQIGRAILEPALSRTVAPFARLSFGPRFEYGNVEPPEGVDEDDPVGSGFTAADFIDTYFVGLQGGFDIDGVDTLANPQFGLRWLNRASVNSDVRHQNQLFARLSSELSYFYTFDTRRQLTLALRAGGATNIGDYVFYQANTLGGEDNLRGFSRTRFAGRTRVFTNAELRASLLDFNAYVTRGEGGVLLFLDHGRVWADGERSGRWHQGYGGGVWVNPFYQFVLTATLAGSAEGTRFDLSAGFLF